MTDTDDRDAVSQPPPPPPPPERTVPQNAQLALLLEVTGTPKPGNVDRVHDYDDLRFEHFMAGAIGAEPGLRRAASGERVGAAFERAVAGMSQQTAGNTQFGALLVLVPLVRAAADGDGDGEGESKNEDGGGGRSRGRCELTREHAGEIAAQTTVADAADFYRSFEHVDVAVDDPPDGLEPLDVRRGADAVPVIEKRELTLYDVMERSTDVDDIAREWVSQFERCFEAADRLQDLSGPVPDRTARVFLELLAERPDSFVATQHDWDTAKRVSEQAATALATATETNAEPKAKAEADPDSDPWTLANELVAEQINPGTTADLTAAALFIALERGMSV